ncbi:adhesion G-protein coupled receptor G6-like isoform X3 [Pomacea canaliculata]|uniref:adhesion G-protein coupled receptor G6-like isoform X3 n=1 Tax=Pomacea canaliculata TaxID=400727 RepID=UPI000D731551|nr:adhesion G-protein coupled receptor G6-like isoform X3 [Pomacea canaliculata]
MTMATELARCRSARRDCRMFWSVKMLLAIVWCCLQFSGFAGCDIVCVADQDRAEVCRCPLYGQIHFECVEKNLTRIPTGLPATLTHLDLSYNHITTVKKGDFSGLEGLQILRLRRNKISSIDRGVFENLYSLQEIDLSGNQLVHILSAWFQHLPSIKLINVSNNQIRIIEKKAFLTLPASQYPVTVDLEGNDIACNCNIRALKKWIANIPKDVSSVSLVNLQCSNRKKDLKDMTDSDFPNCVGSELSVSESRGRCSTCSAASTHSSCDVTLSSCDAREPWCFSSVTYSNGSLSIQKGCTNMRDCLKAERNNSRWCSTSGSQGRGYMKCVFCCSGDLCNHDDQAGRTRSLVSFLTLLLSKPFQRYMMESFSTQRNIEKAFWTEQVSKLLENLPGIPVINTEVDFLSFSNESSKLRVDFLLRQTFVSDVNSSTVLTAVFRKVQASDVTGFLKNQSLSRIYVGSELNSSVLCPAEINSFLGHELLWPETDQDVTVRLPCNSPDEDSSANSFATRRCVMGNYGIARWGELQLQNCRMIRPGELRKLENVKINSDTVHGLLEQLDEVTRGQGNMTSQELVLVVNTLENSLAEGSALTVNTSVQAVVNVLSTLLTVDESQLQLAQEESKIPERILKAVEEIGASAPLTDGSLKVTTPNLIVLATLAEPAMFPGLALVAERDSDNQFQDDKVFLTDSTVSTPQSTNKVYLPPSLLSSVNSTSRIALSLFSSPVLFQAVEKSGKHDNMSSWTSNAHINSIVMAASVVNTSITDLTEPLHLTFTHINNWSGNRNCVFWQADDKSGEWSSRGCKVLTDLSSDNYTTCACDHMTNFALLMDVYSTGSHLSAADKKALSVISYAGCGISLLALTLTLLTYLLFRPLASRGGSSESGSEGDYSGKLRRDNPSRILINLCAALLLSNLVFVAGMQDYTYSNEVACKAVAAILHFALLAGICWMAVEAFYMYLALVRVFKTYFTCFLLKCCLVGWGIPLVIVMLTLIVNKSDNYARLDSGICWLQGIAFHVAFVAPVCVVMAINFTAFALVVWQLMGVAQRALTKSDSFSTIQRLRGAVGVVILLGLTWIFAIFAIDLASVPFYYLFAIFNSLQGLFIFVFYCVLKRDARQAWKRKLPCLPEEEESVSSRGEKTKAAQTGTSSRSYSRDAVATTYVNSTSSAKDSDRDAKITSRAKNESTSSLLEENSDEASHEKDRNVSRRKLEEASNAASVPPTKGAHSLSGTEEKRELTAVSPIHRSPGGSNSTHICGNTLTDKEKDTSDRTATCTGSIVSHPDQTPERECSRL